MATATYKIRKVSNGKGRDGQRYVTYTLTIPPSIARSLPEGIEYWCELTAEGILFRPLDPDTRAVPSWVKRGGRGERPR